MKNKQPSEKSKPVIVKYVQPFRNDIQSHTFSRHGIGYVMRGRKYIYYGDVRHEVKQGDMFYLSIGQHYMEDIPDEDHPFEQIIFFYSSEQLSGILSKLNSTYNMNITNNHSCENCRDKNYVVYPSWGTMKNFFNTVNQYIKDNIFCQDNTAETLKMVELIYLITSKPDCCIKSKILSHIDMSIENFKQVVQKHIFSDISIDDLASECNRSLTSFKKEFKRIFHISPHKWIIGQRLMQSRLLLISTCKSISEIGNECSFPNTSHFIKLFKKEYGFTPSNYRNNNERNKRAKEKTDYQKAKTETVIMAQM